MKHLVFTYGSLKKGFHNHDFLEDAKFVKATKTTASYHMFSLGSFPAITDARPTYPIQGEVYEVDDATLKELDRLEGEGRFYKKRKIPVIGVSQKVWCYFILDPKRYDRDIKAIGRGVHVDDNKKLMTWTKN
ncbi:MAG: gamma-glutamylcyclotransferase [Gammaproteobacteria bacterium]|nr:gamma-glutamylcyclotransferase [Gammaproteobacteria bacterium]